MALISFLLFLTYIGFMKLSLFSWTMTHCSISYPMLLTLKIHRPISCYPYRGLSRWLSFLLQDRHVGCSSLCIHPVQREDTGSYTARAINQHGETSSSTQLTVEGNVVTSLETRAMRGGRGGEENKFSKFASTHYCPNKLIVINFQDSGSRQIDM